MKKDHEEGLKKAQVMHVPIVQDILVFPPLSLNNREENLLNLTYEVWNLWTKPLHTSCFDLSNLPCAQTSKLCTHFLCFAHICIHELLFLQTQTPSLSLLLWELQTLFLSFTMNVSLKIHSILAKVKKCTCNEIFVTNTSNRFELNIWCKSEFGFILTCLKHFHANLGILAPILA